MVSEENSDANEYLELFKEAGRGRLPVINGIGIYCSNFEKYWNFYFLPAEKIIIELRYEKVGPFWKNYNYCDAGDEGEDRIFLQVEKDILEKDHLNSPEQLIRKEKVIARTPYLLSGRSSGDRALCAELFANESEKGPRIQKVSKKTLFILHDISEEKIIGTVEGYFPEKILELEQDNFGHAVYTEWKQYIPGEIYKKFKWELE